MKFIWKHKEKKNDKALKKNKIGKPVASNMKMYYKASVI